MILLYYTTIVAAVIAVNATRLRSFGRAVVHECPCIMPSSIQSGFQHDTSPVFKAEAQHTINVGDPHYTYTFTNVLATFRGCVPANSTVVVRSPNSAASCGVAFTPGTTYILTARFSHSSTPPPGVPANMQLYTVTSCTYNTEWSSCPYQDKVFLYYSAGSGCLL